MSLINESNYHIKQLKEIVEKDQSNNYDLKELLIEKIIHVQALIEALEKIK